MEKLLPVAIGLRGGIPNKRLPAGPASSVVSPFSLRHPLHGRDANDRSIERSQFQVDFDCRSPAFRLAFDCLLLAPFGIQNQSDAWFPVVSLR